MGFMPELDAEKSGFTLDGQPPAPAANSKPQRILLALVVVIAAGVAVRQLQRPEAPPPARSSMLDLDVKPSEGRLILSWNSNSDPVRSAVRALLTIVDGDNKEAVPLDVGQLRTGSILYSPLTAEVTFRLEITTATGSVAETIRFPKST